jgi:enoyl-CoA hydratase
MSIETKDWQNLEVTSDSGVAVVRLNRPEKRNAMSLEMMAELIEVAQLMSKDTSIHAVVLAASGDNFSAGVDMSPGEILQGTTDTLLERRQQARIGSDLCGAWENLEQVTIAAIEGHCIGGGLALMVACDFRIAGTSAWFKLPEVGLGINMSWHSLPRVVALAGPSRAKQLAIFSEKVPAVEALSWGLIDKVVDDDEAFDGAIEWARKVAMLPPLPVRMVKEAVNAVALAFAHATIHMDRDQVLLATQSDDFREGVEAFVEKRKPKFTGN